MLPLFCCNQQHLQMPNRKGLRIFAGCEGESDGWGFLRRQRKEGCTVTDMTALLRSRRRRRPYCGGVEPFPRGNSQKENMGSVEMLMNGEEGQLSPPIKQPQIYILSSRSRSPLQDCKSVSRLLRARAVIGTRKMRPRNLSAAP